MPRFMHLSDTHLGNREYMMDFREEDFYEAFHEAIGIAVEEKVDFVVHSGDLFDTWGPSNRALSELKDSMLLLSENKIPVYAVMGEHDRPRRVDYPASRIFDHLGLKLLGADALESFVDEKSGVFIAGISNMKGSRRENLVPMYVQADTLAKEHSNSVLISHQGVSGFTVPEDVQVEESQLPRNFGYLAFGHVHVSALREKPFPFAYAGSTEINSSSEIEPFLRNGKGVNIVDLEAGTAKIVRRKLVSPRMQLKLDTTKERIADDLEKILHYSKKVENEKKPLVLMSVFGTKDYAFIKETIASFSDRAIFKHPELRNQDSPSLIIGERADRNQLFRDYFAGDEKMANLAMEIYSTISAEEEDKAIQFTIDRISREVDNTASGET